MARRKRKHSGHGKARKIETLAKASTSKILAFAVLVHAIEALFIVVKTLI